ncbi:MAG: sulfatase [Bacteroidia bacterium]
MKFPFLLLACVVILTACDPKPSPEKDEQPYRELPFRPNIIWLVAEDLGPYIPSFGDSTVETPTLSWLAAEGIRYTQVYSPSGVCAPSRSAIATGMYPSHIGSMHMRTGGNPAYFAPGLKPYEAVIPPEVRMHGEHLRMAGYYCTNNAKEDYQWKKPVTAWDESSKNAHWRNRAPGQPFFAIFNFEVTHESRIWTKAEDSLWVDEDLDVPVPPYLPDNEIGRKDIRRMYSNIKEMDAQVGEIIRQLKEDNLLDSTIIFWYADHGGPLPRMKRLCYDSGLHLPLIIRFPDQRNAGEIDDQLVSFVDFKPTILSLAGIEPPAYVDGRAFLGRYATSPQRKYIHGGGDRFDSEYDMIRAVRDHQFKYLRNYRPEQGYYLKVRYREQMPIMQELLRMRDAGELNEYQAQWFRDSKPKEELFDCINDPHELHNLAELPQYQEKLLELREECDRWMTAIQDRGLLPEPEFLETIWPGQIQPETAKPEFVAAEGKVSITCATEGASIGYQILGGNAEQGEHWMVYQEPLSLRPGEKLVVQAHRIGYKPSENVTYE